MAIRKLTNAAYLAANWQDEVESKNDLKKGLCLLNITLSSDQIDGGSVVEANGVIYKSDTNTTISNSSSSSTVYFIYFRDITGTLDFYYSTEVPIWSRLKNGWYGSTNTTWRAVARFFTSPNGTKKDLVYENNFDKPKLYLKNVSGGTRNFSNYIKLDYTDYLLKLYSSDTDIVNTSFYLSKYSLGETVFSSRPAQFTPDGIYGLILYSSSTNAPSATITVEMENLIKG